MSWSYNKNDGLYFASQISPYGSMYVGPGNYITYDSVYGTEFVSPQGGAKIVQGNYVSFYNGAGYNFLNNVYGYCNNILSNVYASNIYASNANIPQIITTNLNVSGNSYKSVNIQLANTPFTFNENLFFQLTRGNYGSEVNLFGNTSLPVGIGGFGNNSNSSNCFVTINGSLNINPANSNYTPIDSKFTFYFSINSSGTGLAYLAYTKSGTIASLNITSYNGLVGGISQATSDIFLFPPSLIGTSNNQLFLFMEPADENTLLDGFYLASGSLTYF